MIVVDDDNEKEDADCEEIRLTSFCIFCPCGQNNSSARPPNTVPQDSYQESYRYSSALTMDAEALKNAIVAALSVATAADPPQTVNTLTIAQRLAVDHQRLVGVLKSLEATNEGLIQSEPVESKRMELTDEGEEVARNGSHEVLVLRQAIVLADPSSGVVSKADLDKSLPPLASRIGFSQAIKNGWIATEKSPHGVMVRLKADKTKPVTDELQEVLCGIQNLSLQPDEKRLGDLKKRKLVRQVIEKSFHLRPGPQFEAALEGGLQKLESGDLSAEMLHTGAWKGKTFKPFNLAALGTTIQRGHLHPLLKVRAAYRQIFLEMGFCEMPTNNWVESSFWNFDALFQPQQHPARDAHDTFFISEPAEAHLLPPQDYVDRVARTHSTGGGFGSQGYQYDWKLSEAKKNLLRTHTTAVSARQLYKLAQDYKAAGGTPDVWRPVKYFSIDRVFRNETLDATHLAEFHQIEGVVADRGLTLGNLMGTLQEFFSKLGIGRIRFKPAYNPYTEPSMEIFSFHPGLQKWVEIGNSGMFRPEMLLPMGLPEDVRVIAWGLGLERPTMIKYGYNNIRDLVGHRVNLQMVYDNPICSMKREEENSY